MKRVSENRSWQNGYNTLDSINYLLEFFTDSVGNLALVLVVSATRKNSSLSLNFKEMFQSIRYILFHGFGLVSIRVF